MTPATESTDPAAVQLDLAADFPPPASGEWKAAAEALLKGAPFDKKMITPLPEGIAFQPVYHPSDVEGLEYLTGGMPGFSAFARANSLTGYRECSWVISQELISATPAEFNSIALHELEHGQNELNIPLDEAVRRGIDPDHGTVGEVGHGGISLATLPDLDRAFAGIHPGMVSFYFRTGTAALPFATLFFAWLQSKNLPLSQIYGCFEADPLGNLVRTGKLGVSLESAWRNIAILTRYVDAHTPNVQTVTVQGHPYANGGATATQELGFAMATATEYLRNLRDHGIEPEVFARHLRFSFDTGGNFFLEIAKLRAARVLWSRIAEAFGAAPDKARAYIHARTSAWNKTAYDPYVNMLRTTTEAFSAVLGGCNGLHISPFDEVVRLPDTFSRRIARNTHHILAEECDMRRVIDPSGGSWAVEKLTDEVAAKAWEIFQTIEAEGGMTAALQKGTPQSMVTAAGEEKIKAVARRRDVIVGTNLYPNASEIPLENRQPDYPVIFRQRSLEVAEFRTRADSGRLAGALAKLKEALSSEPDAVVGAAIGAFTSGATLGEVTRTLWKGEGSRPIIQPVPPRRAALEIETLRKAAEHHLEKTGALPKILQANLGPSRNYRARADWTSGFFQVGGLDVLNQTDFETSAEVLEAAEESRSPACVLAGTDDAYAEWIPSLVPALKSALPNLVIFVAGTPGDNESAWRNLGVHDFVNVRSNNYEMLRSLFARTGVMPC